MGDHRLAADREIKRIGDQAQRMRPVVQLMGERDIVAGGQGDLRSQHDGGEAARLSSWIAFAATGAFPHRALGVIEIGHDTNAGVGTQVQIPQLVAGRDGGHQQVFGIPARTVTPKGGVRGAFEARLATDTGHEIALIGGVMRGALAAIAGPLEINRIMVLSGRHCLGVSSQGERGRRHDVPPDTSA